MNINETKKIKTILYFSFSYLTKISLNPLKGSKEKIGVESEK